MESLNCNIPSPAWIVARSATIRAGPASATALVIRRDLRAKQDLARGRFFPTAETRPVCRDQATLASFCRQRTTAGIGVSGKLLGQLVTPTSPT
jgi:hypothetical protein